MCGSSNDSAFGSSTILAEYVYDSLTPLINLDSGAVLRAGLILAPDSDSSSPSSQFIMVLVIHHSIYDHGCDRILSSELSAMYEYALYLPNSSSAMHSAWLSGATPAPSAEDIADVARKMPLATHSYIDYAVWESTIWPSSLSSTSCLPAVASSSPAANQLAPSEKAKAEHDLLYWTNRLRDYCDYQSELPFDHPRPSLPSGLSDFVVFTIPSPVMVALRSFRRMHEMTHFQLSLATWALLLHKLTHQNVISIGSVNIHRPFPELQNVMGFFLNTLVYLLNIPDSDFNNQATAGSTATGMTFLQWLLSEVKSCTEDALLHGSVPYDVLVSKLKPRMSTGCNPFFQVSRCE